MPTIKNLECLFSQGKITRREFIARASTLGLTVALSPVLFSGKALAAEPKKGGRLRIGTTGMATSDILDPAMQANVGITTFAYGQLYDTLVEIDADSQPAPSLAENWEPPQMPKHGLSTFVKGLNSTTARA
jgi:peptide/nickel transport system substrate-binding protein